MPICTKCGTGFEVADGLQCPKCGSVPSQRPASAGNFFLSTGAVICCLGCIFAVLKTLYGLLTLKQMYSIISVSDQSSAWLIVLILLDGFVWFCLSAALLVVFLRVKDL